MPTGPVQIASAADVDKSHLESGLVYVWSPYDKLQAERERERERETETETERQRQRQTDRQRQRDAPCLSVPCKFKSLGYKKTLQTRTIIGQV